MSGANVTLFVCGDLMTGRGIDQILAHPSPPRLHEPFVESAADYVELAERAHGRIPRAVKPAYVWGDALAELAVRRPHARIVNLETSITTSDDAAPKGINYRMHPANVAVLTAAAIDCATLANNHVLDWGIAGLGDTLETLAATGIRTAGAGRTRSEAESPAVLLARDAGRILVIAAAGPDCGVPPDWQASVARPGVNRLADYGAASVDRLTRLVSVTKRPGDVAVLSIHWGGNWGFEIAPEHRRFAHAVIEQSAIDLVVGHSSHHVKAVEIHRGRPILYGCGDLLNDYEGIAGPDELAGMRDDLAVMHFPTIDASTGALMRLELVPLVIRRFRLQRADGADVAWLRETMTRECGRFGLRVAEHGGALSVEWW